jgi:hypothetical protein
MIGWFMIGTISAFLGLHISNGFFQSFKSMSGCCNKKDKIVETTLMLEKKKILNEIKEL